MSEPSRRVTITTALLISVLGSAVTIGATYGSYKQRFETVENENRELRATVSAQQLQLAVIGAQYEEIKRRLSSIEDKLDDIARGPGR